MTHPLLRLSALLNAKRELGLAVIAYEQKPTYENSLAKQKAAKEMVNVMKQQVVEGGL